LLQIPSNILGKFPNKLIYRRSLASCVLRKVVMSFFSKWVRVIAPSLALSTLMLGSAAALAAADDFLPPEKAFALSAEVLDKQTLRLNWQIADGYYLYQERFSLEAGAAGKLGVVAMPKGVDKFDSNFNKTMVVYKHQLSVDVPIEKGSASQLVTVGYQGCAEKGLCYPPATAEMKVDLVALGATANAVKIDANGDLFGGGTQAMATAPPAESIAAGVAITLAVGDKSMEKQPVAKSNKAVAATDSIASTLASGSLLKTMGVFWIAGLLLAFTPCVLPMVPILSSLIAGQSGVVTRRKGFMLALAYSLGMALIYAGFGVAAGLAGEGLAAALQNPWVLGGFALMLSAMALSMFGVYELQLPSSIQTGASNLSNKFKGGSYVGVFIMGGISALVVGPCVAAPLAGALVYISQTRDVVLGGLALFAMALGMSVPLLLVGASAGSLLPRAGMWMERVKQVFGMMLFGVAIWMVSPVLSSTVHMLFWATWLLATAALLGGLGGHALDARPHPVARTAGIGAAALAGVLLMGAASGGQSILQPLAHLRGASIGTAMAASGGEPDSPTSSGHALPFERVSTMAQLDAALLQAGQKGQPVMLDFYADWCVSCKEFDSFTFSDAGVKKRLAHVRLLQADVTKNSAEDKALLKRFALFGPPGIVFFDANGASVVTHKVIGYQKASEFHASLDVALAK
jgi:thioredoxin:protein disulfide reductase